MVVENRPGLPHLRVSKPADAVEGPEKVLGLSAGRHNLLVVAPDLEAYSRRTG